MGSPWAMAEPLSEILRQESLGKCREFLRCLTLVVTLKVCELHLPTMLVAAMHAWYL